MNVGCGLVHFYLPNPNLQQINSGVVAHSYLYSYFASFTFIIYNLTLCDFSFFLLLSCDLLVLSFVIWLRYNSIRGFGFFYFFFLFSGRKEWFLRHCMDLITLSCHGSILNLMFALICFSQTPLVLIILSCCRDHKGSDHKFRAKFGTSAGRICITDFIMVLNA